MPKRVEPTGFAARLKSLRETARLTQEELAERAGLYKYSVAKLEQGVREPTWGTVLSLANALGVDCRAFDGTGAPSGEAAPAPAPRPKGRPKKAAGGPSETAAGTGQGVAPSERPGSGKGHAAGPGAAPAEGEAEERPRRKG